MATPTPTQQAAIDHGAGPALVLAGPGSGKTFILIRRYARLVRGGVRPDRILLLTFGRSAATQLRERMRATHFDVQAEGAVYTDPAYAAHTFHAFAFALVREFGTLIGLPGRPQTMGTAEQWALLQEIVAEQRPAHFWSPTEPTYELKTIAKVISDAKSERVSPEALLAWSAERAAGETALDALRRERLGEVGHVYQEYVRRGRARGRIDLDDQVLYALELLALEAVREEVSGRYDHLMVDEYQDTSEAQADLAGAVAGPASNLLVVADDDQSIYKFRGASRHNVLRFRARYRGCAVYPIRENRRSTPQVMRASLAVMDGRPHREPKDLEPTHADGPKVALVTAPDVDGEALAVAERVRALHAEGAIYADVAVLGRKHAHLERIARALRQRGIPFHYPGRGDFFRQPLVKTALGLLRAAAVPDDDQFYPRLMEVPAYRVGPARFTLVRESRETDARMRALVPRARELGLSEDEAVRFARLVGDIEALGLMKDGEGPFEVLMSALERSRYLGLLDQRDALAQLDGYALLRKLSELVWRYVGSDENPTLDGCLDHLTLLERTEDEDALPAPAVERDAVRLSTIHGAKGLEFPHVIVVQLMEKELPMRELPESIELPEELVYRDEDLPDDPHEEEERRLFYVAMTRAMRTLAVSHAERWDWRTYAPSPFLEPLRAHADVALSRAPAARLLPPPALEAVPFTFTLGPFSYTMVRDFRRCPRQFAFRYYYGLPPRPSADAVLGRLVHEALRQAGEIRRRGEPVDGARLSSLFDQVWADTRFDKRRFASLSELGRDMVRRYGTSGLWQNATLDLVEYAFPPLVVHGHQFEGKIDRVDAPVVVDGAERRALVDYKTGRPKRLDQLRFDDTLQLALYREGAARRTGTRDFALELHFLHDGSRLEVPLTQRRIDDSLYAAGRTAAEITAAVRARDFPANPSTWNCPPCPYRAVCDEGREVGPTVELALTDHAPGSSEDDEVPF